MKSISRGIFLRAFTYANARLSKVCRYSFFLIVSFTCSNIHIDACSCCYLLFAVIPLFLLFLVYRDSSYMLMLIPVICYLLLFMFSHYFLYVILSYTLNIAISVPAKQVRMLHDREKIIEEVEMKVTVKCST